ncbi:unnamed protein product [Kluyveromyces dobzhanskii CBS 2104]|uniref:Sister chromatid cohesion protein n=1 Tax=Kluyveromyces dobzhanskii CBS 2104 TaxID=1427455 RepID=A0A0A8L7C2_9SACH|nr:unnamed protein product [Kluyveromyces dobzhanskii CBS 2104]
MAKGFPGESSDEIPKRISETLKYQPLNHLVPKTGLCHLLASPATEDISISYSSAFGTPSSEYWSYPHPIDFDPLNEGDRDPIIFKRPKNISIRDDPDESTANLRFLKDLPQLGVRCLAVSSLVDSANIVTSVRKREILDNNKRTLDMEEKDLSLNESDLKRVHISVQSNPMNDFEVGKLCLSHLSKLLDSIGISSEGYKHENAKFWKSLGDTYISTTIAIDDISLTINKVMGYPMVFEYFQIQSLKSIINLCVDNIKIIMEHELQNENERLDLENLAFKCASLILEVMMIDLKSTSLQLEDYFNTVFSVMNNVLDKLRDSDNATEMNISIGNILSFVKILEKFVTTQTYLDEMCLIKSVCISAEMLLHKSFQHLNTNVLLSQAEKIKDLSLQILVSLFSEYPTQRMFIMEELLSHVPDIVVSRSTKKMKLVDEFNGCFASHFTVAVVAMFQSLNISPDENVLSNFSSELLEVSISESRSTDKELTELADKVTTMLLEGLTANPSKFKPILEIYVQDLLNMIENPTWVFSYRLLESLLPSLFQIFGPHYQGAANSEVMVLQLVGQITAKMADVKMKDNLRSVEAAETVFSLENEYICCFNWLSIKSNLRFSSRALWNEMLFSITDLCEKTSIAKTDEKVMNFILSIIAKSRITGRKPNSENTENESKAVGPSYRKILSNSSLLDLYEPALKLILSLLDQQKIKLKSGAVKCLTLLVANDPQMLQTPFVQETIKKRLYDSSASVRDAILDLLEQASTYTNFYREINCHFDDDSVAVRKHVLRMNEKIFDSSSDPKTKAFVLEKILKRFEDEEEVIVDTARQLFLNKLIMKHGAADLSMKVHRASLSETLELLSSLVACGGKTKELLEFFFHFFALNSHIHKEEERNVIFSGTKHLTDFLVEEITESAAVSDKIHEEREKSKYELLYFFANCPGNFISKLHLYSLFPYLSTGSDGKCYLTLLKVFRTCLKKLNNLKLRFLHDLETALLFRLPKFNTREIEEALAICWEISSKTKNENKLLKVCSSCVSQLRPYVTQAVTSPESLSLDGKIQRLIYLSTGFARMCHFKETEKRLEFLRNTEHLYQYTAKCLLTFADTKLSPPLRKIAIRNLVKLACSFPKLFNSPPVLKVLDHEFESGALDIKLSIVECFQTFFSSEEKKILMKIGANGTISSSIELRKMTTNKNTSESINDGVCSALVTRYLDSIMELCMSPIFKDAIIAIKFVQLTLNFNYTNPSHAVPTLIALSSSDVNSIRSLSTKLLSGIFEQYESMVFNGLASGFKKCSAIVGELAPEDLKYKNNCMKCLQHILSNNKKNSRKYITVVKGITLTECHNTSVSNNTDLLFLLHNMSQIDYCNLYELYEFLSSVALAIDEIDEYIQDILSVQEDDEKSINAFNFIKRRKIMSSFKEHLMNVYNISSDKLSFIGTPDETTLRGKSIQKVSVPCLAIDGIVFKSLSRDEINQLCLEYQREYDAIY